MATALTARAAAPGTATAARLADRFAPDAAAGRYHHRIGADRDCQAARRSAAAGEPGRGIARLTARP
ncbi:hypothetical protein KGA66_20785 [Actinocrinis puniceicyclus]|uniref:Uncharacterized protein n=1 Tax=Actinocrinis puniceicyclus TaxID=977794 RepID=A0A8J8BDP6_9ACTN|nr:hypothetical protein [Actinocrinis puniceicyclus]MBS2965498.1 hypothetical protein [Actinocrinis puniceicyclus]